MDLEAALRLREKAMGAIAGDKAQKTTSDATAERLPFNFAGQEMYGKLPYTRKQKSEASESRLPKSLLTSSALTAAGSS